ncbi:uncharacterized protein A4U43_C07F20070 [Asparagus officinalis]|uniref:Uncharacterized protein n=1 Tax=Asparagus officinalis TaxID=4686 RepID=A0A5P1EGE5_ASPOF|nr:uncharacterized protein LOC109850807 [Asparagus officinalis]ONK63899.1 uncharacterized protein A4U43_C07F20070 [Asparagus officinalis]
MGIFVSKCRTDRCEKTPAQLTAQIRTLEEQIASLNLQQEEERRENSSEVERLRRRIEDDEERMRSLEGELMASRDVEGEEWQHWLGTECLVEHMKEEQKRREVQVEKWKSLYLTIKNELDDLILRTKQGGRFILGANEDLIDRLQMEVMAKEETIEMLRSRISLMEKEEKRREREIDILRQSLKILNNTKRNGMRRNQQSRWLL